MTKAHSFECRYLGCNIAFTNRFNLKRHIMLAHSNSRPFHCDVCGKRFALLQYYRDHLLLHLPFDEVDKRLGQVSPSINDKLPLFMVEHTKDEDLLHAYVNTTMLPTFVDDGLLPVPGLGQNTTAQKVASNETATA